MKTMSKIKRRNKSNKRKRRTEMIQDNGTKEQSGQIRKRGGSAKQDKKKRKGRPRGR